jgi:hypothetical protein
MRLQESLGVSESMRSYTTEDFVGALAVELDEKYPEGILEDELYAAVQGLLTSLRWGALRMAKGLVQQGRVVEPIVNIETTDHFASEWMERREVIDRIMHTSGFPEDMSESALTAMEKIVDAAIRLEGSVKIADIGSIKSTQSRRYSIDLVKPMCIAGSPRSMTADHKRASK